MAYQRFSATLSRGSIYKKRVDGVIVRVKTLTYIQKNFSQGLKPTFI
jgi:hypothetical protein